MVGRRVDRVHRWRGAGQRACKPGWSKEGKSTEKRSLAAVMYAQDVSPDEGRPSGTLAHQEHACAHGRPNSLRTSRLCVCQCWPQNATFCSWRHPRAASVSLLLHASRRPASSCLPRCSLPRARTDAAPLLRLRGPRHRTTLYEPSAMLMRHSSKPASAPRGKDTHSPDMLGALDLRARC
jgi:hypothetical protein